MHVRWETDNHFQPSLLPPLHFPLPLPALSLLPLPPPLLTTGFIALYVVYVLVVIIGRAVYQKWKNKKRDGQPCPQSDIASMPCLAHTHTMAVVSIWLVRDQFLQKKVHMHVKLICLGTVHEATSSYT